jgi:DNA-directed RNA polymerase specialized sigma24 family protein
MKELDIFPWNQLIDWYLEDKQQPFLKVLRFIIINHRYFKNKNYAEIMQDYGLEPEDFFQNICFEIDRLFYLRRWKMLGLDDSQLNQKIRGLIKNRIIDQVRRRKGAGKNVGLEDGTELFIQPELQENLEKQESLSRNESKIIEAIKKRLNERQIIILYEYHVFKIGDKGREILALELDVSVKTIESDIRKIKDIVEEEYTNHFPYLKKYSKNK